MPARASRGAPTPGVLPGYGEYEMNLENVLKAEIPSSFDRVTDAPLTQGNVQALPEGAKGAYLLFHKSVPVYAGKTDSRHGFQNRLTRHFHTLQHRKNVHIDDMSFKALRIAVFNIIDVEAILISEMRLRGPELLSWNFSGFGSNDPGRRREGQVPAKFDKDFPIDIDKPLDEIRAGTYSFRELLGKVKEVVPYLLRYDIDDTGQADLEVTIARDSPTMRDLMTMVVGSLRGVQATIFPGRVILYQERRQYEYATEQF